MIALYTFDADTGETARVFRTELGGAVESEVTMMRPTNECEVVVAEGYEALREFARYFNCSIADFYSVFRPEWGRVA